MKVTIRKDEFNRLDLSFINYNLMEGFGIDFKEYSIKENYVNLYFHSPFKRQREVVAALQQLGVYTGR